MYLIVEKCIGGKCPFCTPSACPLPTEFIEAMLVGTKCHSSNFFRHFKSKAVHDHLLPSVLSADRFYFRSALADTKYFQCKLLTGGGDHGSCREGDC